MNSPEGSAGSKASRAISKSVPGPDFLRYYPAHQLMAWQPQGTLDDLMLDQIAEWLVDIEKGFLPFKRFVDLSQLTTVAVRTRHVFEVARRRAEQFTGVERANCVVFRRLGRLWHRVFLRVADGKHADRGARISRSRRGGGMARHPSRRFNAEG